MFFSPGFGAKGNWLNLKGLFWQVARGVKGVIAVKGLGKKGEGFRQF